MQLQLAELARELNNVDEDGTVREGGLLRCSVTIRWNTLFLIRPFSSPFHFVDFSIIFPDVRSYFRCQWMCRVSGRILCFYPDFIH